MTTPVPESKAPRRWLTRLSAISDMFAFPLRTSHYVELVNPLWTTHRMHARVVDVWDETRDARTVTLKPGANWRLHRPGQHIRVGIPVDGRHYTRTYTISSPPERDDGCFTITVKKIDGGRLSHHIVRNLKVGDFIPVGLPQGEFYLPDASPVQPLFITAGSGITPAMSMVRSLIAQERLPDTVHIHYAPHEFDTIFGRELRRLDQAQPHYHLHEVHTRHAPRTRTISPRRSLSVSARTGASGTATPAAHRRCWPPWSKPGKTPGSPGGCTSSVSAPTSHRFPTTPWAVGCASPAATWTWTRTAKPTCCAWPRTPGSTRRMAAAWASAIPATPPSHPAACATCAAATSSTNPAPSCRCACARPPGTANWHFRENGMSTKRPLPVDLTDEQIDEFGREMDATYHETLESRGEKDRLYILRLIRTQRAMALVGRLVIYASLFLLPAWGHALAGWPSTLIVMALGVILLGLAKILENMEISHNVLHAQWDWMKDPEIQSNTWEWDTMSPSDRWMHSHNVVHHTWTNVLEKDLDVGYGIMRVTPHQPWKPAYLLQPVYFVLLMLLFEEGVALHEQALIDVAERKKKPKEILPLMKHIGRKVWGQVRKDYIMWPGLAALVALPISWWCRNHR